MMMRVSWSKKSFCPLIVEDDLRNHGDHIENVVDPPKASCFCAHSFCVHLAREMWISLKK